MRTSSTYSITFSSQQMLTSCLVMIIHTAIHDYSCCYSCHSWRFLTVTYLLLNEVENCCLWPLSLREGTVCWGHHWSWLRDLWGRYHHHLTLYEKNKVKEDSTTWVPWRYPSQSELTHPRNLHRVLLYR